MSGNTHPSRGWRRRAIDAYTAWSLRQPRPERGAIGMLTAEQLEQERASAYLAGYSDGREDARKPSRDA